MTYTAVFTFDGFEAQTKTAEIKKIAHMPVSEPGLLPTADTPGYTVHSVCSVCNEMLNEQRQLTSVSTLTLPNNLKRIQDNAFAGIAAEYVELQNGVTRLGSRAFAGAELLFIRIPASVTEIAEDTFENCGLITVICPEDAVEARRIAEECGFPIIIE